VSVPLRGCKVCNILIAILSQSLYNNRLCFETVDRSKLSGRLFHALLYLQRRLLVGLSLGAFTREVHVTASKDLNFDDLIPLNPFK